MLDVTHSEAAKCRKCLCLCSFIALPSIRNATHNILGKAFSVDAISFRMFSLYPINICCSSGPDSSLNSLKFHCISSQLTSTITDIPPYIQKVDPTGGFFAFLKWEMWNVWLQTYGSLYCAPVVYNGMCRGVIPPSFLTQSSVLLFRIGRTAPITGGEGATLYI